MPLKAREGKSETWKEYDGRRDARVELRA